MSVPAAVTGPQLAKHLGKSEWADSEEMADYAAAATKLAEGAVIQDLGTVGPIVHRQVTSRVDSLPGCVILPKTPVVSVSAMTGVAGSSDIAVGTLDVDPCGIIRTSRGGWFPSGTWSVTYIAGRWATPPAVDEDVRLAVLIIGKHLWETQRGNAARPGQLGQPGEPVPPTGFAVPRRAEHLLAQYVQVPVA